MFTKRHRDFKEWQLGLLFWSNENRGFGFYDVTLEVDRLIDELMERCSGGDLEGE
jgi:hypothetical protein